MKSFYLLLLFLLVLSDAQAQDMKYKFGYLFKKDLLDDGTLYVVKKGTTTLKDENVGSIQPGKLELVNSTTNEHFTNAGVVSIDKKTSETPKTYNSIKIQSQLKGVITKRSREGKNDTLFIKFWDITQDGTVEATGGTKVSLLNSTEYVNSKNNDDDFVFVINPNYWKTHRYLKIPYRTQQFTATSLPFRILAFRKAGNLESDFLNANVSYQWVAGKTRIYQSEFIDARNIAWASGPYLGLSSIDNPEVSRKEFGLNYGWDLIYSLQSFNITGAAGVQNGFREGTKQLQPYFGFGIGFKLVEFFSPEIKDKE